jgi:hypothetical protein
MTGHDTSTLVVLPLAFGSSRPAIDWQQRRVADLPSTPACTLGGSKTGLIADGLDIAQPFTLASEDQVARACLKKPIIRFAQTVKATGVGVAAQ